MCIRIWGIIWGLCCCLIASGFAGEQPIPVGSQRILFVDDVLIDRQSGTALQPHDPQAREVILTCDAPWEGNISAYYTFFEDDGLFRVYYRGSHFDKKPLHEVTCYAESKDGLHWVKPQLGLFELNGSKENNIIWMSSENDYTTHNFTPFKDLNPDCPVESRYKALAGEKHSGGLWAFKSSDGIHWSLLHPSPVITDGYFDSQNLAFWDTKRKAYVSYYRDFRKPGSIRDIKVATSSDFQHWTTGQYLNYGDAPDEQLYTNAIRQYPRASQLYVGFPTRYQPKTQQVEPILMTSQDGFHFHRWSKPLIPITAPQDRDGNRSNYMANGLLFLPGNEREMSVFGTEAYYAGPGSRVRRFTFRTDGFVSVHAGGNGGDMVTKPFTFTGNQLMLNYACKQGGQLQVEVQNADGVPIPGWTLEECSPLHGDQIEQGVQWTSGNPLSSLAGRPVRLKFVMRNADLYALRFGAAIQN